MDALDVITLEQAKNFLVVEEDDDDEQIEDLITTAVAWTEQYTGVYMYPRTKQYITSTCSTRISDFPIAITSITSPVTADDGTVTDVPVSPPITPVQNALSIVINSWYWPLTINADVGYGAVADIPKPLITACLKIITYLYENKDVYDETLPSNIQFLLNPYRRSPTI